MVRTEQDWPTKVRFDRSAPLFWLFAVTCGIALWCPKVVAQDYMQRATVSTKETALEISANSPRPLAQVLDTLRELYDWQINYEDAQYQSMPDYKEVPAPRYVHAKTDAKVRIPSGGSFKTTIPFAKDTETTPDQYKTVQAIVNAYNQSDNPGRFEVRKNSKGNFEVVGTATRDEKGATIKKQLLFDARITIMKKRRSALEALELICSTVGNKTHIPVALGVYPRTIMMRSTQLLVGGSKIPARELLTDVLLSTGRQISWRLLYDPDTKNYFLNLAMVPKERPVHTAATQQSGAGTNPSSK